MNSDRMTRILLEVVINGTKASPADTAEDAALRKRLVVQCQEIVDKGGVVDIPGEFQ
jgi:hypothetical protein